ncbi:unnamed protein product, partial [Brassica oleracea var. botrytis]
SRRRWTSSPALLTFTLCFMFHVFLCLLPVRFLWIVGGVRSQRMLRRRQELRLFVGLLPAVFPTGLVLPPAMSREDSLAAAALLWASGSDPVVPLSGYRRSSQAVDLVQIFQPGMEFRLQLSNSISPSLERLESHGPLCLPAPHLTGTRSQSTTSSDPNLFGDASISPAYKVMLSSPPWKKLPLDSGNTVLFWSFSSSEEKSLSPHPLPMARGTSSDLWSSVCFSSCIVFSSCGAVFTGPEDTSETILVVLVDGVWNPTSLVTILQLSDIVVKVLLTHSSIVSNSLSSSSENLSYLYVVVYAYCQKGWIIPFCPCIEEDQY